MTDETKGATILSLRIKDFQGIRAAELDDLPPTGVVVVQGPVGAGKSSILKAITAALGGKAHVHARATHDDAEGFSIDVELTNGYRIDRHSTPSNPKGTLSVLGPDDGKHGQGILDSLVGPLSFDPLSFMRLSHEKQAEIVLALDSDPDRRFRIAAIQKHQETVKDERRPFNSELLKIRQMKAPEGERPEAVDVSATAAELKKLNEEKRLSLGSVRSADDAVDGWNAAQREREKAGDALANAEQDLTDALAEERLCKSRMDGAQGGVLDMPSDEEITSLETKLAEANNITKALAPWTEYDNAMERRDHLVGITGKLDEALKQYADQEIAEFASIVMPIKEMTVSPQGEVLWKGRTLSLASGGESISIAVAVAFAVNPKLKICMLDEANNIGQPQLEALHKAAVARGFQIWACRLEGSGHVTVADGVATQ